MLSTEAFLIVFDSSSKACLFLSFLLCWGSLTGRLLDALTPQTEVLIVENEVENASNHCTDHDNAETHLELEARFYFLTLISGLIETPLVACRLFHLITVRKDITPLDSFIEELSLVGADGKRGLDFRILTHIRFFDQNLLVWITDCNFDTAVS